ncbi:MAG: efflux transporter outer membrane subunit [Deltaproteobacteria bacterium]|nr:efflux transporter outer membrane subunit [Deltaproteobacteria bacterium]
MMEIGTNRLNMGLVLFTCAILTAGCTKVGPDYVRPQTEVSQTWLDAGDKRVETAPAEYRNWWKAFDDATLDHLIDTAYRENLTLRVAGVRVLEARAQLGAATGRLYPQTQQATGSVQKQRISAGIPQAISASGLGGGKFGGISLWQDQYGLTANWEIDFWGKFRRGIESAGASLQASIANYDSALVSLTADVANAYIAIRTLQKRLDIARHNVVIQKESLQIAEARFQGGTTSERDVEQARSVLASTEATIPVLKTQLRQAKNALSVLLGLPPNRLADQLGTKGVIPTPPARVAVGIPADLLRRRPDIRAAEFNAAAQCAQIGVSRAQLFPAFSLTGNFGFLSSDVGKASLANIFDWRNRQGAMGPAVQWNILNYGQLTNLVRVQDARFQELLITYQNTVLSAQREVEDNLVAFLRTQEQAKSLQESAEAAMRSVNLAVLQYREGITDFTTVLTAQQSMLSAEDSLASAVGSISANLVGVYRALGGGWEIREGRDFVPAATREQMRKRTNWGKLLTPESVPTGPPPLPSEQKEKPLIRPPDW